MGKPGTEDTKHYQAGKGIWRPCRHAHQTSQDEGKSEDPERSADEPKLFPHNTEDKVSMLLGKKVIPLLRT